MSGKVGGPQLAAQQFGNRGAFCDVCDVACSSKDAYEAHIRGVKHQKVNSNFAIACSACVCVCGPITYIPTLLLLAELCCFLTDIPPFQLKRCALLTGR